MVQSKGNSEITRQSVTRIQLHFTWFGWSLTSSLLGETNFWIGIIVLKPGQTIAASQRNISQHCWPTNFELRPNDPNIWTQHIATLLDATCCLRLASLLRRVATSCGLKIKLMRMLRRNIVGRTWRNYYNIMQHPQHHATSIFKFEPATPNISQHGGQTHSWIYVSGNIWTSPRSDKVRNTLSRWKKISSTHYWSLSATNHLRPRLRN